MIYRLEHFDQYTYGILVVVESDHKPLTAILSKPLMDAPRRLQRMLLRLQRYTISLVFKPGKALFVADTLFRAPVPSDLNVQPQKEFETVCTVIDPQLADPVLQQVRQETLVDRTLSGCDAFCDGRVATSQTAGGSGRGTVLQFPR